MTRKIVCIIFFGVIIDLSWKLWHFANYLDVSSRAIPNVVGVILGGLTGVAIFQSARFFEERRVKHILHLLGTAALVDTCAALIGYAGIQTFRWSLLLVGSGLELLGALFCISILLKSRVS